MFLAAQYYRPPFPNRRFWADDLSRMRDSGLHALQLWCVWGWIESEPGVYRYDDYDELMALAEQRGLKVVLSTIGEIHPFWIHRLVPDAHMIDHMGHRVVSSCRGETNSGLTPGGCTDNPRAAELMRAFLVDIASRYGSAAHLIGWDCWNETRWAVQADGHVCYCPHSLKAFRQWLQQRHGGLEGLNAAWQKRFCHWDDVMPGKLPNRPFTEMIEFTRWLTVRAAEHARFRYEAIRQGDPDGFVSAHCGTPAIGSTGGFMEQALSRGVDWDLADQLDGFGCSHFPLWFSIDDTGLGVRLEQCRSANQGKVVWVSELQGGSARNNIGAFPSVDAASQQRWIHSAMGRGAKGIIFWCWRDEVFGRESSGFGLSGWDGLAEQRLAAMARTGAFIQDNDGLIEGYQPDAARVGILFVPDNYLLQYAACGDAKAPSHGINAVATALERLGVPYDFVEARHLAAMDSLDVLLMPWCPIVPEPTRKAIEAFLKRGGRVYMEAETDAFDELGFYRYADERPLMQAIGAHDLGRRKLTGDATRLIDFGDQTATLTLDATFITPLKLPAKAQPLAVNPDGGAVVARVPVGKGAAWLAGNFLSLPYHAQRNEGFEILLRRILADAEVKMGLEVHSDADAEGLFWRAGTSGRKNLLWLINCGVARTVHLADRDGRFGSKTRALEMISGSEIRLTKVGDHREAQVDLPEGGVALLQW